MDHVAADAKAFFEQIKSYLKVEDRVCVEEAFDFARREHGDQRRKSGELFFTHPLTVAYYLAQYHLDAPALSAALLHDVAEDTRVSIGEIETHFGREVARLVDGVTKLKELSQEVSQGQELTAQEIQDASLHKLLAAMTGDVRTVIIKLFDRLHNMRTIKATPQHKQVQKANETLAIYAPLANRLGIWELKSELEALSLEVIHDEAYQVIKQRREQLGREQQEIFQSISDQIFDFLLQANLDVRNVVLEPENIYTSYKALLANGVPFHEVDKTMRLVVLLEDWHSCYLALGHLHQLWKPVPGKFDDYIAVPRDNLYRSLHTTVVTTEGQHLKIRLRTVAMHKVSKIGILARWLYSGTPWWSKGVADRVDAFFDNINENINIEPQNPTTGVKGVVEDVFRQQIRVYTPRGDVVELAQGATPIDFAYAIHTGLGSQCYAAYVNDELYSLNKPLQDGDRVRIVKRPRTQPQRAWLDEDLGYIATNYARYHARRWFRRLSKKTAVAHGKDLLQSELNMLGLAGYSHKDVASSFTYDNTRALYYDLGRAELLPTVVATRVLEDKWSQGPARDLDNVVYSPTGEKFIVTSADNRKLRLCGTCEPRPPDPVVGYVRADEGVTVHQKRCHTLRPERMSGRMLKLGWGAATPRQARQLSIEVKVYDRPGLLFEITQLIQDEQINIAYINTPPSSRKGEMYIILTLEIVRPRQLVRILHQIYALANVFAVRVVPEGVIKPDEYLPNSSLYRPE